MSMAGQTQMQEYIQHVQSLIKVCLDNFMNQKEVLDMLSSEANIEPSFTKLVWLKLEEENREFFKAYHLKLKLKNQILRFNGLCEQHMKLMEKLRSFGIAPTPLYNGSNSSALNQTTSCYMFENASAYVSFTPDCTLINGVSSAFSNGKAIGKEGSHIGNGSYILAGFMDASTSKMSKQDSSIGRIAEMNETPVNTEPSYSSNSESSFCKEGIHIGNCNMDASTSMMYTGRIAEMNKTPVNTEPSYLSNSESPSCNDDTLLEACQLMVDTSVPSLSSSEFTDQPLFDPFSDMDTSFELELTDDFMQDILDYRGSPGREFQKKKTRDYTPHL